MKAKQLFPTKKEGRKLIFEAWRYVLLAVLGTIGIVLAAARGWLGAHAREFWLFTGRDVLVRGWLLVFLCLCAFCGVIQILRWSIVRFRHPQVRLFRSLSYDEQSIMRVLAHCEFGISEGELFERVPASTQRSLYFIEHLVDRLHVVDRTEPVSGGAFWLLSEQGRELAAANHLFGE